MKVIMLTGHSETGKTTVLKNLYEKLTESDLVKDIRSPRPCPESEDDMEYFIKWRDKKVGIVTLGDFAYSIDYYIGFYDALEADVLVIANSMKWRPCDMMNRKHIKYCKIEKNNIHEIGIEDQIIAKLETCCLCAKEADCR